MSNLKECIHVRRPIDAVKLARGDCGALGALLGAVFASDGGVTYSYDEKERTLHFTTRYGNTTFRTTHTPTLCTCPMPCCERVAGEGGEP